MSIYDIQNILYKHIHWNNTKVVLLVIQNCINKVIMLKFKFKIRLTWGMIDMFNNKITNLKYISTNIVNHICIIL